MSSTLLGTKNDFVPLQHVEEVPSVGLWKDVFPNILIPGWGAWRGGRYRSGMLATSGALLGAYLATSAQDKIDEWENDPSDFRYHKVRDWENQRATGSALFLHSSFLSTYESFQFYLAQEKKKGRYQFVSEKPVREVAFAPVQFEYLKRWTTWVPVLAGLGAGVTYFQREPKRDWSFRAYDGAQAGYWSYVAGTGEEAMFRGVLQPVLYENTQSSFWSNSIQALVFGYGHTSVSRPFFQIAAGFYFGWLTERNQWDVGEAVFIHTWWDVFLITAEVVRNRDEAGDFYIPLPVFNFSF